MEGAELAGRFVEQGRNRGVELLSAVGAESIIRDEADNDVEIELSTDDAVAAHAVLIATGSRYRRLGVPGEERLIGATVHFGATCDGPFELLVVGCGNSGFEEGIFLTQFAQRVRIIDRNPQLKASPLLQDKVAGKPQISVHSNTEIVRMSGRGKLEGVTVRAGSTKQLGAEIGEGITGLLMVRQYLRELAHLSYTSINA